MTQKPLLIAVEGCDGTGKTTLVAALVQAFLGLGIPAASIKRPAKDALAAFHAQGQDTTETQVLGMMNSDCRAALDTARALQANGTPIVIFDRHYISAAIYQGGDDWEAEFGRQREMWGEPDVWVFCDSVTDDVVDRVQGRNNDHHANQSADVIGERLQRYRDAMRMTEAPVIEYWTIGDTEDSYWLASCGTDDKSAVYRSLKGIRDASPAAPWIAERILEATK